MGKNKFKFKRRKRTTFLKIFLKFACIAAAVSAVYALVSFRNSRNNLPARLSENTHDSFISVFNSIEKMDFSDPNIIKNLNGCLSGAHYSLDYYSKLCF